MRSTRSNAGFTVIELILATVVLMLLLAFAAAFLTQGSSAHRTVSERSTEQEVLDSITQLFMYDFRLAGYRGASTEPATLNHAITRSQNAVTINYTLDSDPDRPYEVAGAQRVTYASQDGTLTRCHTKVSDPSTCIGGLTELSEGVNSITVDTSSLNGYGVIINLHRTPYDCEEADCETTYTVRIPFPQPLQTGAPQ